MNDKTSQGLNFVFPKGLSVSVILLLMSPIVNGLLVGFYRQQN